MTRFSVPDVPHRDPEANDPYYDKYDDEGRILKKEWLKKLADVYPSVEPSWREWIFDLCYLTPPDELEKMKREIQESGPRLAQGGVVHFGTGGHIESEA